MGLFWQVDDVFWGKPGPGNTGKLLGRIATHATADAIDFREQIGIYVLYSDYRIIYVGQTGTGNQRLFTRLKQHITDDLAGRWDRFSWYGYRWVKKTGELAAGAAGAWAYVPEILNEIEGILIHSAEPPLNRQGGRFGDKVIRYLQVRDERLGQPDSEMLRDLWTSLQNK
jgi:hypothetical protein